MKPTSTLKDQCRLIIQKANRSINTAKRNIEEGDYDFASSRAYYAAFYAIQAILLTKNLSFSKHSAVISAFNQYFVKTMLFPKHFSKLISRLFRERQIGDYDFDLSIDKKDAIEDIESARKIHSGIFIFTQYNVKYLSLRLCCKTC